MEIWQCTDWTLVSLIMKLGELKLGELLDTPPPGLDEAIAISKVCIMCCSYFADYIFLVPCFLTNYKSFYQVIQFLELQEYSMFTRIVFDTAPTVSTQWNGIMLLKFLDYPLNLMSCFWQGHTLRLLSLPDFLDASIGKILKVGMWMESKKTYRNVFVPP